MALSFFSAYLAIALAGLKGGFGGLDDQLALLRATLEESLRGWAT